MIVAGDKVQVRSDANGRKLVRLFKSRGRICRLSCVQHLGTGTVLCVGDGDSTWLVEFHGEAGDRVRCLVPAVDLQVLETSSLAARFQGNGN